jgi:endonuclease YncB( thermonuclease family)
MKPLFFDIESGSLDPEKSPVLSISYGRHRTRIKTSYVSPDSGHFVSEWAREHVLKNAPAGGMSEKSVLSGFLDELKAMPSGSQIAGWNIGYVPRKFGEGYSGFDMSYLISRGEKYGLNFTSEFNRMKIRDLGREYLTDISLRLNDFVKGSPELASETLDPEIWKQMQPYANQAAMLRDSGWSTPKIAKNLSHRFKKVAGWKQESIYELLKGKKLASAHTSEADVGALFELADSKLGMNNYELAKGWNKLALKNRLVSQAKYSFLRTGGIPWEEIKSRASKYGIEGLESRIASERRFWQEGGEVVAKAAPELVKPWVELLNKNKKLAVGIGVAGLLLPDLDPLSPFSHSDEEIESVRSGNLIGGMDGYNKYLETDFGSPWRGGVVSGPLSANVAGFPVAPEIQSFSSEYSDPAKMQELQDELDFRQQESMANLGTFSQSDYFAYNTYLAYSSINKAKRLSEINLANFDINVEDADSLVLKRKGFWNMFSNPIQIRLAGIDAPETAEHSGDPLAPVRIWQDQPGGEESTEYLKRLLEEQSDLRLVVDTGNMTYGRYVGSLIGDDENLNVALAEGGAVTPLPFGKRRSDVVYRSSVENSAAEAAGSNLGIYQMKRYQAARLIAQTSENTITHNTITRLDKMASQPAMGAYGTLLEGFGDETGALTPSEYQLSKEMGMLLRGGSYRQAKAFSSGDRYTWNTISGMQEGGIGADIRKQMTDFGSPWQWIKNTGKKIVGKINEYRINRFIKEQEEFGGIYFSKVGIDKIFGTGKAKGMITSLERIEDWYGGATSTVADEIAGAAIQAEKKGFKTLAIIDRRTSLKKIKETVGHERFHQAMRQVPSMEINANGLSNVSNHLRKLGVPESKLIEESIAHSFDTFSLSKYSPRTAKQLRKLKKINFGKELSRINGMQEGGLAEKMRKIFSDFGSPWRGGIVSGAIAELVSSGKMSGSALRSYMRSSAGKAATVNVGGIKGLVIGALGGGQEADVFKVFLKGKGESVLKMQKAGIEYSVAYNQKLIQPGGNKLLSYLYDEMAEVGDIVPEVYGAKKNMLLMEYIKGTEATASPELAEWSTNVYKKMYSSSGAKHLDPRPSNIIKREGGGYALIDWGGSYQGALREGSVDPALSVIQKEMSGAASAGTAITPAAAARRARREARRKMAEANKSAILQMSAASKNGGKGHINQ